MKILVKQNTTSKVISIFLQDSSSTTGAGLTGLVYNAAGLTAYYYRDADATSTAITLATMTLGTWATGGLIVADGTHMPGVYQIGLPNACFTALGSVVVYLQGATNLAPLPIEIQVVAFDPADGVRAGLTALPNVASGSAGAIPTTGTGANQINVDGAGNAYANLNLIKTQTVTCAAGVTIPTSLASPTNITAGVITTVTTLTNLPAITANWLTAAGIAAAALNGKGDWSTYAGGDTAGTTTLLTRVTAAVALAGVAPSWYTAPVDVSANVTLIKAKTDNLPAAPADETLIIAATTAIMARLGAPVGASLSADVQTRSTFAGGAVASVTAGVTLAAAGLDAVVVEAGLNARQALAIIASSAAGVLAGAATTTVTIAAAGVSATNRITATVDANGNRSAVALSPPA